VRPAPRTVISQPTDRDGRWFTRVRAHPRSGYLVEATGLGLFRISARGTRIWCAPATEQTWRWQRALVGQVLPFASALRGFETLHASAARVGPGVVALSGSSGSGKSSILAELLLGGARFVTDDVLALQTAGDAVLAHPGIDHLSLRHVTAERIGHSRVRQLGTVIGRDENALRLAVHGGEEAAALTTLCLLDRSQPYRFANVVPITAAGPALLLGTTFNFALRTRLRLVTQLDACASIARTCRVVRVEVPKQPDFAEIAAMVRDECAAPRPSVPAPLPTHPSSAAP